MSKFEELLSAYSPNAANAWLRELFDSYDTSRATSISVTSNKNERKYFESAARLGFIKKLKADKDVVTNMPILVVAIQLKHDLTSRDSRMAQFRLASRLIKDAANNPEHGINGIVSQGLFFFYDNSGHFRLSLVTAKVEKGHFITTSVRRESFLIEEGGENPTVRRRFLHSIRNFADLREIFSVAALTKDFYNSLFNWYIWATEEDKSITFPNDLSTPDDDRDYIAEAVIRLLTRLMFVWFIKQKGLVPDELFNVEKLNSIIKDFDSTSKEQDNYYRVILQNLFFATLNCREDLRRLKHIYRGMSHERSIKTCYRYADEMVDPTAFLSLMKTIPFLNCALFDCLDKKEREEDGGRELYLDGFSDKPKRRAHIHNAFFFDEVKGLLQLFKRYEFTVDENSPTDTDVALDPELLGKVFENLLGAYNPETKKTARKATGSFYTPREIVNYMVQESLKAYIHRVCPKIDAERINILFDEQAQASPVFTADERTALLNAIYDCKILDPACGSGAYPMGVLHCMVFVLSRLDENNVALRRRLMSRYEADMAMSIEGATKAELEERAVMLDKQLREGQHYPDYVRKLYLIENCIYGVDIQPIATQISKLRFFISLLCDQFRTTWNPNAENHGLLSLPNLEAKFVCADTLKSLPTLSGQELALSTGGIQELRQKLEANRHLVFTARTFTKKQKYMVRELNIRDEIRNSVRNTLSTPDAALIAKYEQMLQALQAELVTVSKPKMELVRSTEQVDLFSQVQNVVREVDKNEPRRSELQNQIRGLNRAIQEEKNKIHQAGSTELDRFAISVAGWDPYDQNACSDFFDPEWMFNISSGFDIIIGNPPYFVLNNKFPNKEVYEKNYPYMKSGRVNIYQCFFAVAKRLLNEHGIVSYIHPKTLFSDAYLQATREFLLSQYNSGRLVDIRNRKNVFDGVLQSVVITFWYQSNDACYETAVIENKYDLDNLHYLRVPKKRLVQPTGELLVVQRDEIYDIVKKIRKRESQNIHFETGHIEWNKKLLYLSKSPTPGCSQLIYGANIQRYYFEQDTIRNLIYLSNQAKWKKLEKPAIIVQRTNALEQKYRIVADIVDPDVFSYPIVTENNTSVCEFESVSEALYPLGVLNSEYADFFFRLFNSNTHVSSTELNNIPIPTASPEAKRGIGEIVVAIREALRDDHNADISSLQKELDRAVYAIFGLNDRDIRVIEISLNGTEAHEVTSDTSTARVLRTTTRNSTTRSSRPVTEEDYLD